MTPSHLLTCATALWLLSCTCLRAEAAPPQAVVTQANTAYTTAYGKADASAIAALFTKDAEYALNDGRVISGRSAIESSVRAFFKRVKNPGISLHSKSARQLTPNVILEHGFATTTVEGGIPETTRYTATHLQQDGKWLITNLEEVTLPPADIASEALSALNWIIGEWEGQGDGWKATTKAFWTLNGRFITRTFSIKREGEESPFEGAEVIGYDHVNKNLKSWTFDSEGGVGNATWIQEGGTWIATATDTLPDGSKSSAQHIFTPIAENRIAVESINRVIGGQALPNTPRVEITRAKK